MQSKDFQHLKLRIMIKVMVNENGELSLIE